LIIAMKSQCKNHSQMPDRLMGYFHPV